MSSNANKTFLPTVVTVPCFSGAPWDLKIIQPFIDYDLITMRLPEGLNNIEGYADFLDEKIEGLGCYVLVGDSFGAVVSLALATRQPAGLCALILSGGFAANPVRDPILKARIKAASFLPGPLYKLITLRLHAASLSSPYDAEGENPWSKAKTRELFINNTPYRSYIARAEAALNADYRDFLSNINVPTLIITPSYDKLIGKDATNEMLEGIQNSKEIVLERTGHMLRFSHPETYARTINHFLRTHLPKKHPRLCNTNTSQ